MYRVVILKWVKCAESGMDMRNEVREREERGKVGEKMERSKLIVRIPLLQKCGAEMSTDVVEAKQNNRQVNCNPGEP
jgi:hypothetical protein